LERTANIGAVRWRAAELREPTRVSRIAFALVLVSCAGLSAILASWVPLQLSIVTVFLFAGPHNWFELRYFLMRLPARFGRSRNFFLVAFGGIAVLTLTYLLMPALYYLGAWSGGNWPSAIGAWNTLLLLWIATLVWLRGKQQTRRSWSWIWSIAFAISALNWIAPELFSLAIVYAHPLVALWFLDRHLGRARPEWQSVHRRCLCLVPLLIAGICWQLADLPPLANDNGLAWRITQHAGAELLPNVSTHLLVSLHVFLEILHYGVWLVALPLIGPGGGDRGRFWDFKTIPLVRHPRGFPGLIIAALATGLFLVFLLWFGFSINYAATRDIYFAVAIAHVLAEAPFLLRMM
jgi:hypothetical protein